MSLWLVANPAFAKGGGRLCDSETFKLTDFGSSFYFFWGVGCPLNPTLQVTITVTTMRPLIVIGGGGNVMALNP